MGKIIAVVNQKGGVGKTTTAVNLTAALHEMGVRVLLCDFDPQANATSGMGVDKRKIKYSAYDVTINETPLKDAIIHTDYGDVLPSSADLAGATVELIGETHRERVLEKALFRAKEDGRNPGSGAVRVFCAGRPQRSDEHPADGKKADESPVGDLRRGPDHVRWPHQLLHPGSPGGAQALPRKSVCHGDSPEYPSGGGAQPWHPGDGIRPHQPGRQRLSGYGRGSQRKIIRKR